MAKMLLSSEKFARKANKPRSFNDEAELQHETEIAKANAFEWKTMLLLDGTIES